MAMVIICTSTLFPRSGKQSQAKSVRPNILVTWTQLLKGLFNKMVKECEIWVPHCSGCKIYTKIPWPFSKAVACYHSDVFTCV